MEGLAVLLVLLVLGVPVGLAIWLIARAVSARNRIDELARRVGELELALHRLKAEAQPAPAAPVETRPDLPVAPTVPIPPSPPPPQPATPPPLPTAAPVLPLPAPAAATGAAPASARPPSEPPRPAAPPAPAPARPAINWEQFLGVKLFAWVGGLLGFLGVAYFVKYSFDNNLIPPEWRVAIGYVIGLALVVGGVGLHRRRQYTVGAQALCATGVLVLYAITFAARAYYHFLSWPGTWYDALPAFAIMVLVTATGFLLAVRLNALVVAILGMLGGFLTPVLLSTGVDYPLGLFGYIALLDLGLLFVAHHRRWDFLAALAAAGTALMQIAWAGEFFESQRYFAGDKIFIALGVLAGFNALYLGAAWWAKRRAALNWWLTGSVLGLAVVAFGFTGFFLSHPTLAERPWVLLGFLMLIDLGVAVVVWLEERLLPAQAAAGFGAFLILAAWTANSLTGALLHAGLVFYLLFAVVHAVFPVWWQRRRGAGSARWSAPLFPPLALVLVLIPIFKLTELSFAVWPFVLLVDLLAIALAVFTASLLPVLGVLLLTLAATGSLICKVPADLTGLPTSFFLLGGFAVFFVGVSVWLVRKLQPAALARGFNLNNDLAAPENLAALLPACAAILPFLLLMMATLRLPLANPTPVFGVALLLLVLLLGVTKLFGQDVMPAIGLVCVAALEATWHFNRLDLARAAISPTLPLLWYLVFYGVFTLFPFVFQRQFRDKVVPWAVAALAGVPQFFLVYRLVKAAWPNEMMGLIPAVFALPPLLGLVVVLKLLPAEPLTRPPATLSPSDGERGGARLSQLAFFGGVALFFITLIFPIQFDKQWITLGWALEGAALLWLFHRVPHDGLRLTGVALLVAAFVRLALNPEVLTYHARSATPVLNWYLYTYGLVTLSLFVGGRLLAPPRNVVLQTNVPPVLYTLGTVLAFLLVNIEIADAFTPTGEMVRFRFGRHLAPEMLLQRHMTYSIAWGLFALTLLFVGIVKRLRAPRYAAIALLGVTVLKLFFYDLANLSQLYRIGALIGVAVIATLASLAYQRFFAVGNSETERKNETST